MSVLIDGKAVAEQIKKTLAQEIAIFSRATNIKPGLATILVGENPASQVYIKNKIKSSQECGIESFHVHLPESITQQELLDHIHQLNTNPVVHGILVQLPLPKHINDQKIIEAILPEKDVDGFHPVNVGKLLLGQDCLMPCTPSGVMELLKTSHIPLAGQHAVVVGRSNIVGKPLAMMLLQANATVTIAHSKTKNLAELLSQAQIVVAAVGQPEFIKGHDLQQGVVVIDVGINRLQNKLVGDVEFHSAQSRASFITPVPGGVGPMTIAMLLQNTLKAARAQTQK